MKNRILVALLFLFITGLDADHKWKTYAYSGYAWSKKAGIVNPAPLYFTNVLPGDTDDSNLSNANFIGIALHYNLNRFHTLGASYESYATFNYQKFHNRGSLAVEDIDLNSGYERQFFMNHQSAMLEGYLKFPARWGVILGGLNITPLVGAAVGVGINNLFGFEAISFRREDFVNDTLITSIAKNNIKKGMAWRIETGLNFESCNSNVSFGVSYRYYDGGRFATSNLYLTNGYSLIAPPIDSLTVLPPWTGKFKTNQIKMYINVSFD